MNDLVRFANSVEYTTGKKRGRRPKFNANMFYPFNAERRLKTALKTELEAYVLEAYEVAALGETFTADSLENLSNFSEELSDELKKEVSYAASSIAKKVSSSFAEMSEMVVGKAYYPPLANEGLLKDWQANFQMLCKSAKSDAKKEISKFVKQAKDEGWNKNQLERAVKSKLPSKYASRASLIARTESAKLNSQITLSTYKEIGAKYYTWLAAMDERTRPEHAAMNGLICSVSDPTVWYEENQDDPLRPIEHKRDASMVHLHPGDDFQCRCTMVMWDPEIDGKYEVKEGGEKVQNSETPQPIEKVGERPVVNSEGNAFVKKYESPTAIGSRNDPYGSYMIEKVITDLGYDGLPKLVDEKEFLSELKKDTMLLTRTYGTNAREAKKFRDNLYNKPKEGFYTRCEGGHVHGYGSYFGADETLGNNAVLCKRILFEYSKGGTEEFAYLADGAKVIKEEEIAGKYLDKASKGAPTKRLKKIFEKTKASIPEDNHSWRVVGRNMEKIANEIFATKPMTEIEEDWLQKGFCLDKNSSRENLIIDKESTDAGVLASRMGYDAIYDADDNYAVVLNRTKLRILARQKDKRNVNVIFEKFFGVSKEKFSL